MWVPTSAGSGESFLPGCPLEVSSWDRETERGKSTLMSPTRTLILLSWPPVKCKASSSKGPASKYHHLDAAASVYESGGDISIQSTTEQLENKEGKWMGCFLISREEVLLGRDQPPLPASTSAPNNPCRWQSQRESGNDYNKRMIVTGQKLKCLLDGVKRGL